jgi:ceramide glucosyltransferase
MLSTIQIAVMVALAISVAYTVICTIILALEMRRSNFNVMAAAGPIRGVSILKPLKGLDDQLEENLRSFFELDYQDFELIFGIADLDDPAIPLVRRLRSDYPNVDSKIVVGERPDALNLKIGNLANMYPHAHREYLLISDSNVRVRPEFLGEMMSTMQIDGTGLVTSTIRGQEADSLGAVFENLHLNSFVAGAVFAVRTLFGVPISIGKSMLMHRDTVARLGGFLAFGNVLAEDQVMGMRVKELGMKVRTSTFCIDNINSNWSWSNFLNRHVRWAMMRRHLNLGNYSAELLGNPIPIALAYSLLSHTPKDVVVLAMVLAIKIACDAVAFHAMKSDLRIRDLFVIPFKDLLIFGIWFVPFLKTTVSWRGTHYRLTKGTLLQPTMTPSLEVT